MLDQFQRNIEYLRISITDRCNLRCVYCMPEKGIAWVPHEEILRYGEILRLAGVFTRLGIRRIKLTGGEPLCRKGVAHLVASLKEIPGLDQVTLTTNGITLAQELPALTRAGLDGVNLSLDTLDKEQFQRLTRRDGLEQVLEGLRMARDTPGLNVKINCVLTGENRDQMIPLARLAQSGEIAVRFIERMPLGAGAGIAFCGEGEIVALLEEEFGPMTPDQEKLGNGPCRYVNLPGFRGKIGFISAMSHNFCRQCNRIRLTAQGCLKNCLHSGGGVDLKAILRGGADDRTLARAAADAIWRKPCGHRFGSPQEDHGQERWGMSQIGG